MVKACRHIHLTRASLDICQQCNWNTPLSKLDFLKVVPLRYEISVWKEAIRQPVLFCKWHKWMTIYRQYVIVLLDGTLPSGWRVCLTLWAHKLHKHDKHTMLNLLSVIKKYRVLIWCNCRRAVSLCVTSELHLDPLCTRAELLVQTCIPAINAEQNGVEISAPTRLPISLVTFSCASSQKAFTHPMTVQIVCRKNNCLILLLLLLFFLLFTMLTLAYWKK